MTFTYPWGFLGFFSLPLIVWLHRYRQQGIPHTVSCLALWQAVQPLQQEGQQKCSPPLNLILLLELLAASLLSLALTHPQLPHSQQHHAELTIIIDDSVSMQAGNAYQQVLAYIQTLNPDWYFSIILSGKEAILLGGKSHSKNTALTLLQQHTPQQIHHSLQAAILLSKNITSDEKALLIFSDNPDFSHPRLVRVGEKVDNTAIIHANWKKKPFIVLKHYSYQHHPPNNIDLTIHYDKQQQPSIPLDFTQTAELAMSLDVPENVQRIDIQLPDDSLIADNHITLFRPPVRKIYYYLNKVPATLKKAILRLQHAIPLLQSTQKPELIDIWIDSRPLYTYFSLVFPDNVKTTQKSQLFPSETFLFHPFQTALQGFDQRGLLWYGYTDQPHIDNAHILLASTWTTPHTALIQLNQQQLYFNIDLQRSNFLQHNSFPIIIYNLVKQLDIEKGGLRQHNYRLGQSLTVQSSTDDKQSPFYLQLPNTQIVKANETQSIQLAHLSLTGIYYLYQGKHPQPLAVNFFDNTESDTTKRLPTTSLPPIQATMQPEKHTFPLHHLLTFLALCCILLAWWLWQKQHQV